MIKVNGQVINPLIFSDNTSQVWKYLYHTNSFNSIIWEYENESEVFHIFQILHFLNENSFCRTQLLVNYLPYARQDKSININETFALKTFIKLLDNFKQGLSVHVVDVHNPKALPEYFHNLVPNDRIKQVILEVDPDLICFPDKGASLRGYRTQGIETITLDKKRNQSTGEIEGLEYLGNLDLKGKSALIVDDLCDGARTFIEASKLLYKLGVSEVNLYTSHGIYSKGTKVIFDSGIKRIFNYKEEVLND